MQTSSFKISGSDPRAISIARKVPNGSRLSHRDPARVAAELGEDAILLCHDMPEGTGNAF
jgi:hypothetical protein